MVNYKPYHTVSGHDSCNLLKSPMLHDLALRHKCSWLVAEGTARQAYRLTGLADSAAMEGTKAGAVGLKVGAPGFIFCACVYNDKVSDKT